MIRKIARFFLLLAAFCLSGVADERFPDSDIQWILDQYQVAEPVSLIPAEGLTGWTWHYGKEITQAKWSNPDGKKLLLDYSDKTRNLPGGDLVTAKQYTNFVLDFVWISTRGGNSGIKYRLKDFGAAGAKVNYSKDFGWLGCEYQILDDFNNGEGNRDAGQWSTASLYSVFAPDKEKKKLKPHGEVNTGRIVVLDNHIEHWLNGVKVLQYEIGSETWKKSINGSKFWREDAKAEGFGENPSGFIMLQDHQHTITFEKVVIREISGKKEPPDTGSDVAASTTDTGLSSADFPSADESPDPDAKPKRQKILPVAGLTEGVTATITISNGRESRRDTVKLDIAR